MVILGVAQLVDSFVSLIFDRRSGSSWALASRTTGVNGGLHLNLLIGSKRDSENLPVVHVELVYRS